VAGKTPREVLALPEAAQCLKWSRPVLRARLRYSRRSRGPRIFDPSVLITDSLWMAPSPAFSDGDVVRRPLPSRRDE
jgi:hypothetical protein